KQTGSRTEGAVMAQKEGDVRDYNLTEEQKAIKANYPPVNRNYEYLDHTLHTWGDTLEEAFEQCAMAMFGYITDTGTVEPLQTIEVETQGVSTFLFHFLDEWLYKHFKLQSFGCREEFSLSKHTHGTEVKVMTYSAMQVYNKEHPEVFMIIYI
uniref:Protein archease n=1 Tax=Cercocebus atys TaxID=9531 RepID=A0A2K5MFV7_CERAT